MEHYFKDEFVYNLHDKNLIIEVEGTWRYENSYVMNSIIDIVAYDEEDNAIKLNGQDWNDIFDYAVSRRYD